MGISKTPQGTWRARIRDRQGRQTTKTFKLKADALAWERAQLRIRDAGGGAGDVKLTVAEWSEQWLGNARNLSDTTIATYQRDLDRHILPTLGDVKLPDLTADSIDELLTAKTGQMAASSVHRLYRTIHRLCETALRRGLLGANPAKRVDPPRLERSEMRFLSVSELESVADHIQPRLRAWVLVAGYGGLRWGELQGLRPEHFDGKAITVVEQLDGASLKTKKSRRRVTLPASVARALTEHIATYPGDWIFTMPTGQPLSHAAVTKQWKKALKRAGVDERTRVHDLRHTSASILISAGAHPKMVADMLGHSTIVLSMDRYGHLFAAMHDNVASDLDRMRQLALDPDGG